MRASKAVILQKIKQARASCKLERDNVIRREKYSLYPSLDDKFRSVELSYDVSWQNRMYARNSLNGVATWLNAIDGMCILNDIRCKGFTYDKNKPSGSMEVSMLS